MPEPLDCAEEQVEITVPICSSREDGLVDDWTVLRLRPKKGGVDAKAHEVNTIRRRIEVLWRAQRHRRPVSRYLRLVVLPGALKRSSLAQMTPL